ncbi:hypothetical protein ACFV4K_27450 [Nocardia sp. NPDC059764]
MTGTTGTNVGNERGRSGLPRRSTSTPRSNDAVIRGIPGMPGRDTGSDRQ